MSFRVTGSPDYIYDGKPDHAEIMSQIIGLISASGMCALFGVKTYNVQYKYLSYSKWLVIILYIFSWAFTVSGIILVMTNNGNYTSCLLSELACDVFYAGTKITIYLWLIEKVWVVNAGRTSRWNTKSYRIHICMLSPYLGIFVLMIYFHNAWIEPDGHCSIGLKPIASIPLMTYDFIINLYMTVLFVRPLMKIESDNNGGWRESRLRDVAKRTMVASMVCLIVSFANVCALTILHGYEPGVICLTCCFVDVMINVCTVHWVTTQRTKKGARHTAIQPELSEDSKAVPTITTQTSQSDASQEKKKQQQQRYRFDPLTQQYGEFGHSAWPSADISDYHPTVYMSATGNTIHTSPVTAYQPQHIQNKDNQLPSLQPPAVSSNILGSSTPISYHYVNGRFVMITDKDDDDTHSSSQSSCIQDPSSSQSLTIASSDSSRTRVD